MYQTEWIASQHSPGLECKTIILEVCIAWLWWMLTACFINCKCHVVEPMRAKRYMNIQSLLLKGKIRQKKTSKDGWSCLGLNWSPTSDLDHDLDKLTTSVHCRTSLILSYFSDYAFSLGKWVNWFIKLCYSNLKTPEVFKFIALYIHTVFGTYVHLTFPFSNDFNSLDLAVA